MLQVAILHINSVSKLWYGKACHCLVNTVNQNTPNSIIILNGNAVITTSIPHETHFSLDLICFFEAVSVDMNYECNVCVHLYKGRYALCSYIYNIFNVAVILCPFRFCIRVDLYSPCSLGEIHTPDYCDGRDLCRRAECDSYGAEAKCRTIGCDNSCRVEWYHNGHVITSSCVGEFISKKKNNAFNLIFHCFDMST